MSYAASPSVAGPGLAIGTLPKAALAFGVVTILAFMYLVTGGFGGSTSGYPEGSEVPEVYWPMHVVAAEHYEVNPYLLASIHMQESRFSGLANVPPKPANGVASGLNDYGCCAGPMQFNMSNTWEGHQAAFRPIAAARPSSYPLDRRELASCRGVPEDQGCVYDDFDAIAAAAHKLHEDGADLSLDSAGTHNAVCAYIGDCAEVDDCVPDSPNQYCQVLPRAREWERLGAANVTTVDASAPILGGAKGIVERAAAIAGAKVACTAPAAASYDTCIASDYRPTDYDSDHSGNDGSRAARDIAVPGVDALVGPPSATLDRAVVAIGARFGRSYEPGETIIDTFEWKGYQLQVIWRTPLYGGHMGHIHIGARQTTPENGTQV